MRPQRLTLGVAFVLLLLALSFGYYIIDLFIHPSVWNTIVFVGMFVFLGIVVYTNMNSSPAKRKRRRFQ